MPLVLPSITLAAAAASGPSPPNKKKPTRHAPNTPSAAALQLLPFELAAGGASPLRVLGTLNANSYTTDLTGPVDLATAAQLLRSLGFARWAVLRSARGEADVSLEVEDRWMHAAETPAQVRGTVALRDVTADTAWLPATLHIAKADVALTDDAVIWKGLQWTWAGAKFDGSASKARLCEDASTCAWHLTAHTPILNLTQVESVFSAASGNRGDRLAGLFRVGGSDAPGGWPLFKIDLTADILSLVPLEVAHASATLTASGSTLTINQCSGIALAGTVECAGTLSLPDGLADLTFGAARVNLAAAGNLFHEKWGHGTVEAQLHLVDRQGSNAAGEFTAKVQDAGLASTAAGTPLSRIDAWQMSGTLADGRLKLERSLLSAGTTDTSITGSVGLDRTLDLTLKPQAGGPTQHVGGTVQAPAITR
jgi:hypothetical protein